MTTITKTQSLETATSPNDRGIIYNRMASRWELPLALLGGTAAMRLKGEIYLPKHPAESQTHYDARLRRTVLRNYYKRTVKTLTGKVFAQGVILSEEMPDQLKKWSENIDLAGTHVDIFGRNVFNDAIGKGLSYILVDHPQTSGELTLQQERELGVRPYMVHIKAENLISFSSQIIGGVETLTEIRIHEEIIVPNGTYGQVCKARVRVMRPGSWELWDNVDSEWLKRDEGATSLNYIPLFPVYTEKLNFMEAEPPLEDLAYMNLEHWQVRSDQRTSLSFASFPILAASGWNGDQDPKIVIGPNQLLATSDPQGKFYYVESGGAHLTAGQTEITALEEQMRLFGLQFEQGSKSGDTTATEKSIDTAEGAAPLHTWAMNMKDAMERAYECMEDWAGGKRSGKANIDLNSDFGLTKKDEKELDILQKTRQQGDLTRRTYLDELQVRGVLQDDVDIEAEIEALEEEDAALMDKFQEGMDTLPGGNQDTVTGGGDGGQAE